MLHYDEQDGDFVFVFRRGGLGNADFVKTGPLKMIGLPGSVKIYLASGPADLRKGFNGLSGMVREWGLDLYSGHLFVFFSRRGNSVKILTWDRGGFVVWHKRLEMGRYRIPKVAEGDTRVQLDGGQLSMLLDGVDFSKVRRQKRWETGK
jgi:transposase